MRILKRSSAVVVGLAALILGSHGPAVAAASFTWSFSGDYGVYSRDFKQPRETDIYVKVSRWSPCVVGGDPVDFYVYLYKNDAFDNTVGTTKKVTCTGTAKWAMVNPGTYYFRLLIEGKHRDHGTNFTA